MVFKLVVVANEALYHHGRIFGQRVDETVGAGTDFIAHLVHGVFEPRYPIVHLLHFNQHFGHYEGQTLVVYFQ